MLLLLLYIDLLHLRGGLDMGLDWGSLYHYGLAGSSHHLGSDQLKLLGVQLDRDLLDLPIRSNYLLNYLDAAWWGATELVIC